MTGITHHISEDLLARYAAGRLPHPFAVVVAAHVALCDDCRACVEAHDMLGGALVERLAGADLSPGAEARLMQALDDAPPPPAIRASGVFPAPVMQALDGHPPEWRMLGGGIRQQILSADGEGSLRLLYIPPGRAVPEHGHRGLELTLVLEGAFADQGERFGPGDVEISDESIEHRPVVLADQDCLCLTAADAPLRFRGLIPRLVQPFLRI